MKKRILSIILAIAMIMTMIPQTAFAENVDAWTDGYLAYRHAIWDSETECHNPNMDEELQTSFTGEEGGGDALAFFFVDSEGTETPVFAQEIWSSNEEVLRFDVDNNDAVVHVQYLQPGKTTMNYNYNSTTYSVEFVVNMPQYSFSRTKELTVDSRITDFTVAEDCNEFYFSFQDGNEIEFIELLDEFNSIATVTVSDDKQSARITVTEKPEFGGEYQLRVLYKNINEDMGYDIIEKIYLYHDEPTLAFTHPGWDEEDGWYCEDPDAILQTKWETEAGCSGIVYFYFVENGEKTLLTADDLSIEDASIALVHSEYLGSSETAIETNGVGTTRVNYTNNDVTYSVDIVANMPAVGFFTTPAKTEEGFVLEYVVTDEQNTLYLVGPEGCKFTNYTLENELAACAQGTISEDGSYITFTFSEDVPSRYCTVYWDYIDGEGGVSSSHTAIKIMNGSPALVYRDIDWNNGEPYENDNYELWREITYEIGSGGEYYFYALKDGNLTNVTHADIQSGDENIIEVLDAGYDNVTYVHAVGVGETTLSYTSDDITYEIPVSVKLPLIGAYSQPEAKAEYYLKEVVITEDMQQVYFVIRDGWKFTNVTPQEFDDVGTVKISEDGTVVTATVSDQVESRWYELYADVYHEEYQQEDRFYFGANFTNYTPGLKIGWDDYPDGEFSYDDCWFESTWHRVPGNSEYLYFYYVEGGVLTKVKASDLAVKDEGIVTVESIPDDEYRIKLTAVGVGETTIDYTVGDKTYSFKLVSELPSFGIYSSPLASAETLVSTFCSYEGHNTFYFISRDGAKLTAVNLMDELSNFATCEIDSLNPSCAAITINEDFEDGYQYLNYTAEFSDGSSEESDWGFYLENGAPALKYHWGYWINGEMTEETGYYESSIYETKGTTDFLYFYYRENDESTRVTAEQLTVSGDDIVEIYSIEEEPNATRVEITGFGSAQINYSVDDITYSVAVESMLPGKGFFSHPFMSEETYLDTFTVTDDCNTFYLHVGEEFCIEEFRLCDEFAEVADAMVYNEEANILEIHVTGEFEDGRYYRIETVETNPDWGTGEFTYEIGIFNGKSDLKYRWGYQVDDEIREDGENDFSDAWYTVPGNSSIMYFYVVSGDSQTRVTYDQLESSDENVVRIVSEESDSNATRLEAVGFGEATISCKIDGQTYSMNVVSELPEIGFYSAPEATLESYIRDYEFTVTETQNTFYMIALYGRYFQNFTLSEELEEIADVTLSEDGKMATITVTETPKDDYYYVESDTCHEEDSDANGYIHYAIRLVNGKPSLKFYWGEWNNDNLFERNDEEMQGYWRTEPGNSSTMYFYTVKEGKTDRAIFGQLESTNEDVVVIKEENRDSRAVRLEVVGFGSAEIQCTIDGVTYSMPVESTLPEVGFYSSPAASQKTFLTEFDYTEENNTFYLVSNGEFVISNPVIGEEFSDLAKVELDESGLFATITITGTPEDGRWLHMDYDVTNVNNPEETWGNGRGIEIKNNMPSIKYRYASYENGYMEEDTEYPLESTWYSNPGYSNELYVYYVKDGVETRLNASRLSSSDESVVRIGEAEDSNGVRFESVGFGEAAINCTVDGETYSLPVVIELPGFGFYSENEVSEENYITEYTLTEDTSVIYLLAKDGYVMSDFTFNEDFAQFAEAEVYEDGTGAKITITGEPSWDGRYGVRFFGSNVDFPEDSWESGADIQLINNKPGLRWVWSDVDVEEGDIPFEKDIYAAPGETYPVYVYYVNGDEETKLSIDDIKSSEEDVVRLVEAENGAVIIEVVGFGTTTIDYVVDGEKYSLDIVSELPKTGFFLTTEFSEETFINEFELSETNDTFYLMTSENSEFKTVSLKGDTADIATATILEDNKQIIEVKITGNPEDGEWLELEVVSSIDGSTSTENWGLMIRNTKPALKFYWSGRDDEDNLFENIELGLNNSWQAEPGNAAAVYFYAVSGNTKQRVKCEELTSSDENVARVIAEETDKNATWIEVVGFGTATISCEIDGTTYSMDIISPLPDFGFYSSTEASIETHLDEFIYNNEQDTLYLVARNGWKLTDVRAENELVGHADIALDGTGTFATIKITEDIESTAVWVAYDAINETTGEEILGGGRGVYIENGKPALKYKDSVFEDGKLKESEYDIYENTLWGQKGITKNIYLYHVENGKATRIYWYQINSWNEEIVKEEECKEDPNATAIRFVGFGTTQIDYSIDDKIYCLDVVSELPGMGFHSSPEHSEESFLTEFTVTETNNTFYFVAEESEWWRFEEATLKGKAGEFAEINLLGDRLIEIKITGDIEYEELLEFELVESSTDGYTSTTSWEITVRNGKSALRYYLGEVGEDGLWENTEAGFNDSFYTSPDDSAIMFFYAISGNSENRVTFEQLKSSDENIVKIVQEDRDANATRLEIIGFGTATVTCVIDGIEYSMKVVSELPEVGFYSKPEATEENYINEITVTETENTFYMIAQDGKYFKELYPSEEMNAITNMSLSEDGEIVTVTVLGTPKNYNYDVEYVLGDRENNEFQCNGVRTISINDGKSALKFYWGKWDVNDNLFENKEEGMQSNWEAAIGTTSTMYLYVLKDGKSIRVTLDQLKSTNEDVVIIYEQVRDTRAIMVELVGFGDAAIECTIDGETYSMPIKAILPDVAFYTSSKASGETYLSDFNYSENNRTFYLVSNGEYIISSLRNESDGNAEIILDESGLFATVTIIGNPEDGSFVQADCVITSIKNPNETKKSSSAIMLHNYNPGLYYRWALEDNGKIYEDNGVPLRRNMILKRNESDSVYVYVIANGTIKKLSAEDIFAEDETMLRIHADGNDSSVVWIEALKAGETSISYEIGGVVYNISISIRLPEIGFYTSNERTEATYCEEFEVTDEKKTLYFITNDEWIIDEFSLQDEFGKIASYEIDETKHFAKITIEEIPTDGKMYSVNYKLFDTIVGEGRREDCLEIVLYDGNYNIENAKIVLSETYYVNDGNAKEPSVTIEGLVEGKDFEVSYLNNSTAGTAQVVVSGLGDYRGTKNIPFSIVDVSEIVLEQEKVTLNEGETKQIKATAVLEDGNIIQDVKWVSSNEDIVSVENGTITAVSGGSAKIQVKAGIKVAELEVTVYCASHTIDEWIVTKEPTVKETGFKVQYCSVCGIVVNEEEIPMLECTHSYSNYISDGNATCMEDGTKTATCDICERETHTIPDEGSKLPHRFIEYVSNEDATYNENGTETAICANEGCDEEHTREEADSMLKDSVAPSVTITIDENRWNTLVKPLVYDLFTTDKFDVIVDAVDNESGIASVEYYVAPSELADVTKVSDWTTYKAFSIDKEGTFVVYVKVTDKQGNVTYVSSNGLVIDRTAPVVEGVSEGGKYCDRAVVTVDDMFLGSVSVNGEEVELFNDGFTLSGIEDGTEYVIEAYDRVGNKTSLNVTVFAEHIFEDYQYNGDKTESAECSHGCGTIDTRKIRTGWNLVDGEWYYFDQTGKIVCNKWIADSKGWCYVGADGRMLYNKWIKDSKGYCFVDESGYMVYDKWCEDENGLAYAGSDGYRQTSKWIQDSKGWSYVDKDGYKVYNEWVSDCYIDDTGYMATNKWIETEDGWCYVGANGYKTTNKWVQRAGKWAYLGADGYVVTNQWVKDSTGWCYLDDKGFVVYDQWVADSKGLCYVGSNGYMVTNKWVETAEGMVYVGGSGYKVTNDWVKDSNGLCYLGEDGLKVYNQWVTDENGICYIGADGYVVTNQWVETEEGWCYLESNGYKATSKWVRDSVGWCYLDADGFMVYNQWVEDSKGLCYVGSNGYMVTNQWFEAEEGWCYLGSNGYKATSQWMKKSEEWCYLGTDGYVVTSNWVKDGSRWCYMDENGFMTKDKWINDGTGLCYLDVNGYLVTNKWIAIGEEWCYVGSDGYKVTNQWRKDSAGWCYLGEDGFMLRNQWVADSKGLCYVDASGYMVYNKWVKDDGQWCYVGSDGYKVTNKWVKDSTGYCYVDGSGYMVYSKWIDIDENRYYVNASGYRVENAWAKIDGAWYYFKEEGIMARNETIGSDIFDENGVWIP